MIRRARLGVSLILAGLSLYVAGCVSPQPIPPEEDGVVTILAGGDVEWGHRVRKPDYYFGVEERSSLLRRDGWRRLPYTADQAGRDEIERLYGRPAETDRAHYKTANQYDLSFESDLARDRYPLRRVADALRKADIAFLNLETPLTDGGRLSGAFRTSPGFAEALSWAGVDVVSTANNHAFDAEGVGLSDTLQVLDEAGVRHVGTGQDISSATRPVIITKEGVRIAFLAYTYGVNPTATTLGFATPERSGAAPLDPIRIVRDIKNARQNVDIIVLSLHWGLENKSEVHAAARQLGHDFVDAGADIIIGHHPHLPRGVEAYGNGLIAYSLGNFLFSHGHDYWTDNFLLQFAVTKQGLVSAELLPVAGVGRDIVQPYLTTGQRAQEFLEDMRERSAELDTNITVLESRARVALRRDTGPEEGR